MKEMSALLLAAALAYYVMGAGAPAGTVTPISALHGKDAARGVQMKCQEKYCPPNYQIQVDRAQNTLLRDESQGRGTRVNSKAEVSWMDPVTGCAELSLDALGEVYASTKDMYFKEAHQHPGVRLVAHTVA